MNVAIFETEHFEVSYALIRLFDHSGNQVTIFCYEQSRPQLEFLLGHRAAHCHWIIKNEAESRVSFVIKIYKEVKKRKIDLLYLSTISDNFIFYALLVKFLPGVRAIMGVHMINTLFLTKKKWIPRRMVRSIGKKFLRRFVDEYTVLSESMVSALQNKLGAGKQVHCIPGGLYESPSTLPLTLHRPVNLVIPGSIDEKRRNYDQVLDLLELAQRESLSIHITFLGSFAGYYGEKIAARSREWNTLHNNLRLFESGAIEQEEFDKILASADFVFTPSVIDTMIQDDVPEKYGESMSTGSLFDAIRHARPLIIPKALKVDAAIEISCTRYEKLKDLIAFLKSVSQDPTQYEVLAIKSRESALHYTIPAVRDRNKGIFV
jgi:hypothetical protein